MIVLGLVLALATVASTEPTSSEDSAPSAAIGEGSAVAGSQRSAASLSAERAESGGGDATVRRPPTCSQLKPGYVLWGFVMGVAVTAILALRDEEPASPFRPSDSSQPDPLEGMR